MKKTRSSNKEQVLQLVEALSLNGEAIREERTKQLTHHDLKRIAPKTDNQKTAFELFTQFDHIILNGSAGSGKSLISIYHALFSLLVTKQQNHIKIIRSAVPVREQGFVKGTQEEKNSVYEAPYQNLFYELLGKQTAYEHFKKAGKVSFDTTGYLRGMTWNDTFVIVDEAASMTLREIDMLVTRIGDNTRIVFCGDNIQSDLKQGQSGYNKALKIWGSMNEFGMVTFTHDDICRNPVVKSWLIAMEKI